MKIKENKNNIDIIANEARQNTSTERYGHESSLLRGTIGSRTSRDNKNNQSFEDQSIES